MSNNTNRDNLAQQEIFDDLENSHFDECPEKKYFTQTPNVIFELDLDPIIITYYLLLKKTAGDRYSCFKSKKTLAKEMKCCPRKITDYNKILSSQFEQLNGKSLIRVVERFKPDGSQDTNVIFINNIWHENTAVIDAKIRAKKKRTPPMHENAPPPCTPLHPPRASNAHKEEPSEEYSFEQQQQEPVVVVSKDQEKKEELLKPFDLSDFLLDLFMEHSFERIKNAVELTNQTMPDNPAGFLRRAIEGAWTPNANAPQKNKETVHSIAEKFMDGETYGENFVCEKYSTGICFMSHKCTHPYSITYEYGTVEQFREILRKIGYKNE